MHAAARLSHVVSWWRVKKYIETALSQRAHVQVMNKAIDIHDRVMRGLLGRYYGFEVTTEGDAFQFVFHHAADAVAYAVAAQQALLTAKWPGELEQHFRTRTRYATENSSVEDAQLGQTKPRLGEASLCRQCIWWSLSIQVWVSKTKAESLLESVPLDWRAQDVADSQRSAVSSSGMIPSGQSVSDIMFWGLAVRMVIASGHVERCQTHAISNRVEYQGASKSCWRSPLLHRVGQQESKEAHTKLAGIMIT